MIVVYENGKQKIARAVFVEVMDWKSCVVLKNGVVDLDEAYFVYSNDSGTIHLEVARDRMKMTIVE